MFYYHKWVYYSQMTNLEILMFILLLPTLSETVRTHAEF